MKRSKICLVFTCLFCLSLSSLLYSQNLEIITENWPPQNYMEKGKLKGPAVNIVKAIQKKLGSTSKIKVLPWKKGYKSTLEKEGTALFSVTRTGKRENLFKWVGPLLKKEYGLFVKKGSKINIKTLRDAKNYKVGVQKGGVTEEFLKSNGFTQVQGVKRPEHNIRKLNKGHIDLWYDSNATMVITAKKMNLNPYDFKMIFTTETSTLFLAFHKKTSDDTIKKWQMALNQLYSEGEIKKIFTAHNNLSLYYEM